MEVVRRIAVLGILPLAIGCVSATPIGNVSPPRIALVGDSWPLIMRYHGGFKEALVEEGYRPRQVRNVAIGWSYMGLTETRLSFPGIETHRYNDETRLQVLDRILARYPTIDIVHLSLGGADLLHDMPTHLPPARQEAFMRARIIPHIDAVLTHIETKYPRIHVALVGYDYLNLRDTRETHARTAQRWEELGRPEPVDINEMMWRLNQLQYEIARAHPRVEFIDCMGLTKARFAADTTIWEPSPREGLWKDGLHLSREGNAALARHCLDTAYREWLFPLTDSKGRPVLPRGKSLAIQRKSVPSGRQTALPHADESQPD